MGSNISHQSRKDNHVTSFPFIFLFRSLTTIPRTDMFKITERALKTIWITKLPHPLVQAASVATFHQITIYMGKREACSIPGQITIKGSLISGTGVIYILIKETFCMRVGCICSSNSSIMQNMSRCPSKKIVWNKPVERHLSKARWLMANCLQTTTCFDLAWNSNQAWHDWILTCNQSKQIKLHHTIFVAIKILWHQRESVIQL